MARTITEGELVKLRSGKQASKLYLAIHNPAVVYTARVNQAAFDDPLAEVTYDGGSGTLENVLPGMTMYVGSAAGDYDLRMVRIRKDPSATVFYIGETSEIVWVDNAYITVVDEMRVWQRSADGDLIDHEIVYSDQHKDFSPVVVMGPAAVLWLSGATVVYSPDASESYVLGPSAIDSYSWSAPGASATEDLDTATPTITYNAAGTYRITCTVTAANGKTSTGYRYVFVFSAASMPVTQFELGNCAGAYENGGWEFDVKLYAEAGVGTVKPGALVVLFGVEFYNDVQGSIGPVTGVENVIAEGWIDDETLEYDFELGTATFKVGGLHTMLGRMSGYPAMYTAADDDPTSWSEFSSPTIDKALFDLLYWRSTVMAVVDVFLSGDTRRMPQIELPIDRIWNQIENVAEQRMLAKPCCDRYNRLFVQVDTQYLASDGRTGVPVVMGITSADWREKIQIEVQYPSTSMVELAGILDDTPETMLYSRAPGKAIKRFGYMSSYSDLVFDNQVHANVLSGMILAKENNQFPWVDMKLAANNRMIDIAPRQRVTVSVAAGETPRGVVWNEKKVLARRISFVKEGGVLLTDLECEGETSGPAGVTFYVPPPVEIGSGGIELPPFESPSWPSLIPGGISFPPYVPPPIEPGSGDCPTDAPANGPYQLYIFGEISSTTVSSRNGVLHCIVRTSAHDNKTTYQIQGSFQKLVSGVWQDTNDDGFYEVEARNSAGVVIATGVHDAVTNPNVRTGVLNAISASEISHIFVTVNDTELLRPANVTLTHLDEGAFTDDGEFDWIEYGSGIQARALNVFRTGSTIWTGATAPLNVGIQIYQSNGSQYWAAGDVFKLEYYLYLRNEWVSGGGAGIYNDYARLIQARGSLAGSAEIWRETFSPARHLNGDIYSTAQIDYFEIPNTIEKIANFVATLQCSMNGQLDSYKTECVEYLLRAWKMSANSYRIVASQVILWNVCPPEE